VSTDLHAQLDAAVRARLDNARSVLASRERLQVSLARQSGKGALSQFWQTNDPTRIVKDCERDLAVIERHAELPDSWGSCAWCIAADPRGPALVGYPCPDLRDLAVAYGLLDPTAGE
jgi:hypothetical protein